MNVVNQKQERLSNRGTIRRDLFAPITLGPYTLQNRIVMAPMAVDYMVNPDGSLNQRVVDYYLERARNGVGLIICSVFKVENRVEALEACAPMITEASLGFLGEICDVLRDVFGTYREPPLF